MGFIDHLMELALAFTTEVGSRRLVWAAVGEPAQPETLRGGYISACEVQEVADFVLSPQGVKLQDHLWFVTVQMSGPGTNFAFTGTNWSTFWARWIPGLPQISTSTFLLLPRNISSWYDYSHHD